MKATGLVNTFVAFILLFTTVSAWGWFPSEENALARRQNNNQVTTPNADDKTTENASASKTTSGDEKSSATESGSKETDSASGTESESGTRSGTKSGSGSKTTSSSKSTLVDPRLPAGGIALVTPALTEGSQYYKVGDFVTFEWNYTSLSNTPAAIDVYATCSLNSATYTIASNMSVKETGRVIWDTGDSASISAPFPVATYTLIIHDSARDPTQIAAAGDLGAFNQFRFGMYTGQPYTPLNEFKCSTCSAALSLHERQALGVLGVTMVVTVLSFSWFANGFGLFT